MASSIIDIASAPKAAVTRFEWVDYAKGIAIILVVYRHMLYGLQHSGLDVAQWIIDGNNMLFSFRMPLFFLLSGLFFQAGLRKRGPGGLITERVNNLLYPYIIWAVIQITLQIIFAKYANANRTVWNYLDIIVQPRGLDQLWYLFALFNVTAFYLFNHVVLRMNERLQLLLGLVFLALAPLVMQWSTFYDVMLHYIFFAIGVIAAPLLLDKTMQTRLASGYNLLLFLPVFVLSQWYFLYHQQMNLYLYAVIALTGSIFMMMLSAWLSRHQQLTFMKTIGHYSLFIYLMHVMLAAVIRSLLLKSGLIMNVPLLLLILIITAIPLSILAYKTLTALKMGWLFKGPFTSKKQSL
ncbi:fucose 4-O-acetylase-like acetyltransferase [Chitinophaga dinghuensis]|uniref:Fucose 4-O-acetylase-like acetyltransferase n=1 Tax=Chitinophaga dinghuensis TaxID=1539050 RepID=A0A327W4Q6_9BACT|nr:acyltransferase [Chitinophaga dinghuensis]RAJ79948.1 fucose 4-O-acetylase-like acetyltransferase [Chitinophaga dinghuensis]